MDGIPTKYIGRNYRSRLEARWAMMFDLLGWRYEYEPYDLNGWIPDFAIFDVCRTIYPPQLSYNYDPIDPRCDIEVESELIVEIKPYSRYGEFDPDNVWKTDKKYWDRIAHTREQRRKYQIYTPLEKIIYGTKGTEKEGKGILLLGSTIKKSKSLPDLYVPMIGWYGQFEWYKHKSNLHNLPQFDHIKESPINPDFQITTTKYLDKLFERGKKIDKILESNPLTDVFGLPPERWSLADRYMFFEVSIFKDWDNDYYLWDESQSCPDEGIYNNKSQFEEIQRLWNKAGNEVQWKKSDK